MTIAVVDRREATVDGKEKRGALLVFDGQLIYQLSTPGGSLHPH